jgi:hypothetical protein
VKLTIEIACSVAAIAVVGLAGSAHSEPRNLRAYCAVHKNYAGPGENGTKDREVLAAGANTWRCMDAKVMVCNWGASGAACERTSKYDADRRRAFTQFCQENPDSNYIAEAVSRGLASTWRCDGTRPVQMSKTPVDQLGYYRSAWHALK